MPCDSSFPPAPDLVTVMIHDMPHRNYYRGRTQRSPAAARPDPIQVVSGYLAAMEAREIEAARAMLGDGFCHDLSGNGAHAHAGRADRVGEAALQVRHQDL